MRSDFCAIVVTGLDRLRRMSSFFLRLSEANNTGPAKRSGHRNRRSPAMVHGPGCRNVSIIDKFKERLSFVLASEAPCVVPCTSWSYHTWRAFSACSSTIDIPVSPAPTRDRGVPSWPGALSPPGARHHCGKALYVSHERLFLHCQQRGIHDT